MKQEIYILGEKLDGITQGFSYILPELVIAISAIVVIIADLLPLNKKILSYLSIAGIFSSLYFSLNQIHTEAFVFSGFFYLISSVVFFKVIFAVSALIFIAFSLTASLPEAQKGEYYAVTLVLLLGLNMMSMAANFLAVYLSIETVSICSYILAAFNPRKSSAEAGMKYILFGAFSSGIMLYGISLMYGITQTLNFHEVFFTEKLLSASPYLSILALIFILSGFLFKITAFPFHAWVPDVYEGVTTPVAAFFSVAPKAAGLALLMNFLMAIKAQNIIFNEFKTDLVEIMAVLAIITLTVGNFAALWQNNAKRLLAYSSIGHAGFMLSGLIVLSDQGRISVFFYLVIYLFMNFAAFMLVNKMSEKAGSEDVRNFKGLGIKLPYLGFIFVLVMVALTGLPPTAGFYAKFLVFSAVLEAYQATGKEILLVLFVFGLLNTAVALYYYLKIPYLMFFRKAEKEVADGDNSSLVFISFLCLPLIVLFFKPDWLLNLLKHL